ncbi:unnamed protein product, partial [Staurois parvus]
MELSEIDSFNDSSGTVLTIQRLKHCMYFVSINGSIYGNKYIQCFNRCLEGQSQ